jgi:hypothetical protein
MSIKDNTLRDFIGQPITEGCWLAGGARGNVSAEYGMILYQVIAVAPKVKVRRLKVSYPNGAICVTTETSVLANLNKYVVIEPPKPVIDLFTRALMCAISTDEYQFIAQWIHGTTVLNWEST